VLSSNIGHFTPADQRSADPYVALRLLSVLFSALAVLVAIVGGLIVIFTVLAALGSAGAAARLAPPGVSAGILGAGLLGGLFIALATVFYALLLWALAQGIHLMMSIEGLTREGTATQRAILAELRRSGTQQARGGS
jgi:hypothetical protein